MKQRYERKIQPPSIEVWIETTRLRDWLASAAFGFARAITLDMVEIAATGPAVCAILAEIRQFSRPKSRSPFGPMLEQPVAETVAATSELSNFHP